MIQSRSPPGHPRPPSSNEGMLDLKQGALHNHHQQQQQQQQQQHGHVMQSRTKSTSHGVRSRSNGRRGRRYTQLHDDSSVASSSYDHFRQQKQQRERSSVSDTFASHDFNGSASHCQMVNEDMMDENGRCIRHAGIELCRREGDVWRVLLQDCPLCSMDVGGDARAGRLATSNGGAAGKNDSQSKPSANASSGRTRTKKGAESSLQTATTSPLSEEEECKSWTLSDASMSDDDGGRFTKGAREKQQSHQQQQQQQQQQEQQPPPPPRKKTDKYNDNSSKSSNEKALDKKKKHSKREKTRDSSRKKQSGRNDQVASLKELGRKLAMENSASATTTAAEDDAGTTINSPGDDVSMGGASRNTNHFSTAVSSQNAQHSQQQQQQQQQYRPPPPRRLTSGGSDLRSLSTKELSELRRVRKAAAAAAAAAITTSVEGTRQHTQGRVMDEASELISRMAKISTSDPNSEKRKRSSRKKSSTSTAASIGSTHVAVTAVRDETEAILGAAAEARARVLSRRNKLLGNSNQDLEIPYNDDTARTNNHSILGANRRGGSEGNVTEEEMNDEGGRGRGRGDDDILGAAAEIRLRARRSLSRSRERVKAASIFCGETPTDYGDEDDEENDGNETVGTTHSKRSILNPHGLSVQPQAPSVERRSQSRGKERQYTDDWSVDERHNHVEGTSLSRTTERRPRSRNRRGSQVSGTENNNVSSAVALITRRREMRQRIAERQSNAEKRHGRSFNDLDQSEKVGVDHLADAMLNEWNSVSDDKVRRSSKEARDGDKGRRGRSRSVVRDGLSKIRSASLNAFRKSITSSHGAREEDNCTVDTGKRSTQSSSSIFSRLTKKKQGRSLSRSRSDAAEFDARGDCKSDSFALQPGGAFASPDDEIKSSSGSILQRFSLSKSKNDQVRSLSRGSFRDSGSKSGIYASFDRDEWMTEQNGENASRSSIIKRLSKTKQSKGSLRSLSRSSSIDGEMDQYKTTKSESFAMNRGTVWAFEDDDEMHSSNRFSKRSSGRKIPF